MAFKMFKWVPDDIYDSVEYQVRYEVIDGNPVTVISRMWLDKGGPDHVDPSLRLPWGTFPDLPPKPLKK